MALDRYNQFGEVSQTDVGPVTMGLTFADILYTLTAASIKWFTIPASMVGRIDLIAWNQMNDPTLGWVIFTLNGMSDPWLDTTLNRKIAIPVDFTIDQVVPGTFLGGAVIAGDS